jgi:hypothetical protein
MHLKSRFKIAEISFCNNQSPYFFWKFGENYYDIDTACQFLAQVLAYSKFQRMLPHINSQNGETRARRNSCPDYGRKLAYFGCRR